MTLLLNQRASHLGDILISQKKRLTTAESCTGGLLAATLTDIAGCSAWFERGFITYSNESKTDLLQVRVNTLNTYGAVSEQTAFEMAVGALNNSRAALAIAITGIAGPSGSTVYQPVGTVYIAWATPLVTPEVHKYHFTGNRYQVRQQTVSAALNIALIKRLLAIPCN